MRLDEIFYGICGLALAAILVVALAAAIDHRGDK
jgi:hypothetical protein